MGKNHLEGLAGTSRKWRHEEPHVLRNRMEGQLGSAMAG